MSKIVRKDTLAVYNLVKKTHDRIALDNLITSEACKSIFNRFKNDVNKAYLAQIISMLVDLHVICRDENREVFAELLRSSTGKITSVEMELLTALKDKSENINFEQEENMKQYIKRINSDELIKTVVVNRLMYIQIVYKLNGRENLYHHVKSINKLLI